MAMNDLTVILLTANKLPDKFYEYTFSQLLIAKTDIVPLIIVSKKRTFISNYFQSNINLIFNTPSTHINIYREALAGAKEAKTKYIAICEDDVLYSPEHFKFRPKDDTKFYYNVATWGLYTWVQPPTFHWRRRRNHNGLICTRDLYIQTLEERFAKYKDFQDEDIPLNTFAEPGRYEGNLDLTIRETEDFMTDPPNIMFSHPTGMQHNNLGMRKRMGILKAYEIPYFGRADKIIKMYE